ncbi:MAG: fatty acid cis/trans isomerase [Pseudomonadales bacterium]|nr:fatty acid cis/trans isomerase [Pseudomonadales bacterium]
MGAVLNIKRAVRVILFDSVLPSILRTISLIAVAIFSICAYGNPASNDAVISFQDDIKPIFDKKCISCHACYDAPCQLKLTSAAGAQRGSSKTLINNGKRPLTQDPTRLFMDATSTEEWRKKGFISVLGNETAATPTLQASLLHQMISLRHRHPFEINKKLPQNIDTSIKRKMTCPTLKEFRKYAKKKPYQGMPLAVTGLSDKEYKTLNQWITEGAQATPQTIQLTQYETRSIAEWENFLNKKSHKESLVSQYLYEHLFIAHLYFTEAKSNHFFELIRSSTPSDQAIRPIATARPNDKPSFPFYYRLRPIHSTIVHKTHITYGLNAGKLKRFKTLFLSGDWQVNEETVYNQESTSNPFITFAAIPAKARYQFMLDDAEFFIRSFIRGPVCRGEIATDVIRDHFWVLFQSPDSDLFIVDQTYQETVTPLLGMPGLDDDLLSMGATWVNYRKKRYSYVKQRRKALQKNRPLGPGLKDIWDGEGYNTNALLSIFRHHDNATVRKGLIGRVPQTMWVMDYPLFERSYYELAVNFNVFGNVLHQAQTRLYFDLIRNESELNFLRFMPAKKRRELLGQWYQDTAKLKLMLRYENVDDITPSAISYQKEDAMAEFIELLLGDNRHINRYTDSINRCKNNDCARHSVSLSFQRADQALSQLTTLSAKDIEAIRFFPDITFIRVFDNEERQVYSLIRNRAHSNVAYIFGENSRLIPENDTLTIYPGILGSYPNFIFNLSAKDIPLLVGKLQQVSTQTEFEEIIEIWGVRRTHPDFWAIFHDFSTYLEETNITEAGIFDMSRYKNL